MNYFIKGLIIGALATLLIYCCTAEEPQSDNISCSVQCVRQNDTTSGSCLAYVYQCEDNN